MEEKVLITDIQKFAVNDGPGFRTLVFLKGCPLQCRWCHNPETLAPYPELYWKRRMCVQCGACLESCSRDAINPPISPEESQGEDSPYHKIIRNRCNLCMECVDACSYGALEIVGKPMMIEEILDEVESDRPFYDNSGGGMTLSGGEPTAHIEFAGTLLKGARKRGLHNCLDTSGFCNWEVLNGLIENVDVVLYDLKHTDPVKHKEWTDVDNTLILKNLQLLSETGMEIWVRIPVVPGFNDSMEDHNRAADFLANLPGKLLRVDLLPYHNWCQDKYGWLGIDWDLKVIEATEPYLLEVPLEIYKEKGLNVTIGGSGFEESN